MRWRFAPATDTERQLRGLDRLLNRAAQRFVTAAYSATEDDEAITADTTAAAFAITLPTVTAELCGRAYTVVKVNGSANTVTVQASGSQTIDGSGSFVISSQYSPRRVMAVQLSSTPTYGYVSA